MGLSHGVVAHWMEILKPTPKNRRQMLHASRAITASFCRSFQAGAVRNRFLGDTSAPVVRNQTNVEIWSFSNGVGSDISQGPSK